MTYPDNGDVVQLIDVVVGARVLSGHIVCSHESEEVRFFLSVSIAVNKLYRQRDNRLPTYSKADAEFCGRGFAMTPFRDLLMLGLGRGLQVLAGPCHDQDRDDDIVSRRSREA